MGHGEKRATGKAPNDRLHNQPCRTPIPLVLVGRGSTYFFLFQRWIIGGDFDQGPAGSKQKTREGHVGSSNALSSHLELIDLCVKRACRYISTVASGAEESAACK